MYKNKNFKLWIIGEKPSSHPMVPPYDELLIFASEDEEKVKEAYQRIVEFAREELDEF